MNNLIIFVNPPSDLCKDGTAAIAVAGVRLLLPRRAQLGLQDTARQTEISRTVWLGKPQKKFSF